MSQIFSLNEHIFIKSLVSFPKTKFSFILIVVISSSNARYLRRRKSVCAIKYKKIRKEKQRLFAILCKNIKERIFSVVC